MRNFTPFFLVSSSSRVSTAVWLSETSSSLLEAIGRPSLFQPTLHSDRQMVKAVT